MTALLSDVKCIKLFVIFFKLVSYKQFFLCIVSHSRATPAIGQKLNIMELHQNQPRQNASDKLINKPFDFGKAIHIANTNPNIVHLGW